MNRKKLLKLSLCAFIAGICVLALCFFVFHFVTDDGITGVWQSEAGKPFVTELIGTLGVLFIFCGALSLMSAFIFFKKE